MAIGQERRSIDVSSGFMMAEMYGSSSDILDPSKSVALGGTHGWPSVGDKGEEDVASLLLLVVFSGPTSLLLPVDLSRNLSIQSNFGRAGAGRAKM